jgi:hypothetical protein
LHLVWPAGAEDIVTLLAADRVPGIPRDPDTLADILLERGLAVPRQAGDHAQRYWRLAPAPLARDGQVVTLTMLRLASPDLVLAGVQPVPARGCKPEPPKIPSPQLQPASFSMRSARRPNASFTYSNVIGSTPCSRNELLKRSRSDSHCRCSLSISLILG